MFPAALRRDVLVLLAVKAALLAGLYLLFFSPANHPAPDNLVSHILGR